MGRHSRFTSSRRSSCVVEPLEQRQLLSATPAFVGKFANTGNFRITSVASDLSANVYLTGTFAGAVDFDPSGGTHNGNATTGGPAFVAKYDFNGKLTWVRQFGGNGGATPAAVLVDPFGSVLIVGTYAGAADLNTDPAVTFQQSAVGNRDIFFIKLDSAGAQVLVRVASTAADENVVGAGVDAGGNIYIAANLVQSGMADRGYVARFNGRGKGVVLGTFGNGTVALDFTDLTATTVGDVLLSGTVAGAGVDLDLNQLGTQDLNIASTFFLKLHTEGSFAWVAPLAATGITVPAVTTDLAGNLYAVGGYSGAFDFNPSSRKMYTLTSGGDTDAFLAKYDYTGTLIFARGMGGATADTAQDVAVDVQTGEVAVTGTFTGKAYFNPFISRFRFYSLGGTDAFLSRFSKAGAFLDGSQFGGTAADAAPLVAAGGDATTYIAGVLAGTETIDLDPGPGVRNVSNSNSADTDGYLAGLFYI